MQRKKQKMVLLVLAALGFGMFLSQSQSQGQAASTRADVPAEMTAEEAADKANICGPTYCRKNPTVCALLSCPGY